MGGWQSLRHKQLRIRGNMSNWLIWAWCALGVLWVCDLALWCVRLIDPPLFVRIMSALFGWL